MPGSGPVSRAASPDFCFRRDFPRLQNVQAPSAVNARRGRRPTRASEASKGMRTLEELDIATVAVYSEPDAGAPHVRRAGEAHRIGPAADSYLRGDRILETAARCGADAIHPGSGPLAESADFARGCADAGIAFIGPPAGMVEAMNSKAKVRALIRAAGVPVLRGSGPVRPDTERRRVEVQVLADAHGNVVHLGERACSIQRERQTLIGESPAPGLDPAMRERVVQFGVDVARAIGYRSAGTVEGLIAGDKIYFVAMNVRGQVRHRVSEMVTGLDIVREQVLVAAGRPLSFTQADVWIRGHAIECRISAEDASRGFAPAPGEITRYHEPTGHFVRVDSGVADGSTVLPDYDPTIATLIVWDRNREAATRRMLRALDEYEIEGPGTLLPFHRALLDTPQWASADPCSDLITDRTWLDTLTPTQ